MGNDPVGNNPVQFVSRIAQCANDYGLAVVRDEEGQQHQAIIDLNANDGSEEPRALIVNERSRVTAIGEISEDFVRRYSETTEVAANQRNLLCHNMTNRVRGLGQEGDWYFPVPRPLDTSQSRQSSVFRGLSIAPLAGFGFITDGDLLDFNSPFPQGITRFIGAELTIDFDKLRYGNPAGRSGELAIMYYWAHAEEKFDQGDLPFSDEPILPELQETFPLGDEPVTAEDLVQFSSNRVANGHFAIVEWRWPSNTPVWQNHRWSFIHPRYSVGAGLAYYSTLLIRDNGDESKDVERSRGVHIFATGATQVDLVELRTRHFEASLGGGVRVFAGQIFGMVGEARLRLTWRL